MSILDIKDREKRSCGNYIIIAVCCYFFSSIYNLFGHGVHSFYMDFLFLWPLLGAVWYLLVSFLHKHSGRISRNAMGAGTATLTAGSLLKGIFEIAGTSSPYEEIFFLIGMVLLAAGMISNLL